MRRIVTLSALFLSLLGGLLVAVTPATAAPAQPVNLSTCETFGGFEYCYQEKGVIKENTSASGNTLYVVNSQYCYQVYAPSGDLVSDSCSKYHYNLVAKDGDPHVYHSRFSDVSTFEWDGTTYTCTSSYHVVYANGEYRHEEYQFACNPPL